MAMTRIDKAIEYGKALLDPPTNYGYWGGEYPFKPGAPMWAYVETGHPPNPKNQVPNASCTGLVNLMAAAGGSDFRGGTLLYGEKIKNKRKYTPGMRLRRGEVLVAAFGWGDEGHIVMVLEDGNDPPTIGSDHTDGGTKPGVNVRYRAQRAHALFGFEWVGVVPGLELPSVSDDDKEPERPEPERPKPERPEPERPEPERPEPAVTLFTARQLLEIAENPHLGLATAEKYRNVLIPEMRKAGITTPLRMAALFGNVMVETDRLNTLEEYGDEAYFRYGPPEGDGIYLGSEWRYHGRGFLMNTWRDAYARLSRILGEDLLANPDLLARPDLAAKAATWFWTEHDLNAYADRDNFRAVAAIINTGQPNKVPNHWLERLRFYDRAKRVLSSGPSVSRGDGFNRDGLPYINLAAVGQADETAAFALAEGIRRAGIGVTVTNGVDNVYAFAEEIRPEPLGYRQLWIMGQPALDACGDYGDLANWPASQETDYYDLAGKSLTGTCRRAAELADEKAKEGVGRRFLEEMGMANHAPAKPPLPAPRRDEEREDRRLQEEEEYRRPRKERAEKDQYYLETTIGIQEQEARGEREGEEHRRRREERAKKAEKNPDSNPTPDYEERTDQNRRRPKTKKEVAKDGGTRGSVEALVAASVSGLAMQYGLPADVVNEISVTNISLIIGFFTLAGRVVEALVADGEKQ